METMGPHGRDPLAWRDESRRPSARRAAAEWLDRESNRPGASPHLYAPAKARLVAAGRVLRQLTRRKFLFTVAKAPPQTAAVQLAARLGLLARRCGDSRRPRYDRVSAKMDVASDWLAVFDHRCRLDSLAGPVHEVALYRPADRQQCPRAQAACDVAAPHPGAVLPSRHRWPAAARQPAHRRSLRAT